MRIIKSLSLLFLSIFLFSACSDDDSIPVPVNEQEIITDVSLTFTDSQGKSATYTYTSPQYRTVDYSSPHIQLAQGEVYTVSLAFYDKSNPDEVEDITAEVKAEKDEHFVEYRFDQTPVHLTRTDDSSSTNSQGIAIGLLTQWSPSTTGEGHVEVTLIHAPASVSTEDPLGNHQGGETDAQVEFDLSVQ